MLISSKGRILHNNAASYLLVKSETDYVADRYGIIETIDSPVEEMLEAMEAPGIL